MKKRSRVRLFVAIGLAVLLPVSSFGQQKKVVSKQADLPRFSYPVKGTATALLEADDATFNAFAAKVRSDLDSVLADYDIEDRATVRQLLSAKLDLEELAGENEAALKTVEELRAAQDKPAAKLLAGLFARARLKAAMETKSAEGSAYEEAFKKHYAEEIDGLSWDVVQDPVKSQYSGSKIRSKALYVGDVKTELDPAVEKSEALNNLEAYDLVSTRADIRFYLPLEDAVGEVLKKYIAAHNVVKPDIWAAREVTLTEDQKLTPTLVAIWDSGIDVSVFPKQLFNDPKPTASGTHGLAFDDQGGPSQSWLYPLTAEQQKEYPEYRGEIKGILDMQNGVDSPEAEATQRKFKTMSPDQIHDMFELDKVISFYIHGTHCAGIAVRGNPAARLVVMRFNDQLPDYTFPPTEEWVKNWERTSSRCRNFSRRATCGW